MANISVLILLKSEDNVGLLANIGFVLGLSASKHMPDDSFGPEVIDGDGNSHKALTRMAHHGREAGQNKLRTLRAHFSTIPSVEVTDYTRAAMPSSYEQYTSSIAEQSGEEIEYIGIHLFGPEDEIVQKTKNLSRR